MRYARSAFDVFLLRGPPCLCGSIPQLPGQARSGEGRFTANETSSSEGSISTRVGSSAPREAHSNLDSALLRVLRALVVHSFLGSSPIPGPEIVQPIALKFTDIVCIHQPLASPVPSRVGRSILAGSGIRHSNSQPRRQAGDYRSMHSDQSSKYGSSADRARAAA